jgi:hypothetical protein
VDLITIGAVTARDDSGGRWIIGILITVVGIMVSAVVTLVAANRIECPEWICRPDQGPSVGPRPGAGATIALTPDAGPAGTRVTLRLTGFDPGESVTIKLTGDRIASTQVDGAGSATQVITIPVSLRPGSATDLTITGEGDASHRVALARFRVTGS